MDGEQGSNSLSLEKDLGWSGLLAEGDPSNIKKIKYEEILLKHDKNIILLEFLRYN